MGHVYYLPHGGGPLPLLGDPNYARLGQMLGGLGPALAEHEAVIVVTAHWECPVVNLTSAPRPSMLYDYNGFPDAAYKFQYTAPGAPELAASVAHALNAHGLACQLDAKRGYDHGTFVPMMLMRPQADIPVLQMSLLDSLDPAAHIGVGRALGDLANRNVAIVGSGFSFHNMAALMGRLGAAEAEGQRLARAFHEWLEENVCAPDVAPERRAHALESWSHAPGARFCHPREEHLLPLHVCLGAAEADGLTARTIFSEPIKGFQTVGFHWS